MKVLIAFQGDSRSNSRVAGTLRQELEKRGWKIDMQPVLPMKDLKWFRHVKEFRKKKKIELRKATLNLKKYDLVILGTPVWTYQPTPVITSYIRSLSNVKGKKFVLFATCVGFPGTTIKRMSNILAMKAAKVEDSFVVRSIFELDEKKLADIREFASSLPEKF